MQVLFMILLAAVALHVVMSTRVVGWPRPRPGPGPRWPVPGDRRGGWKRGSVIDEVDETDDVSDELVNAVVRAVNEMEFEETRDQVVRAVNEMKFMENRDEEDEDLEEY